MSRRYFFAGYLRLAVCAAVMVAVAALPGHAAVLFEHPFTVPIVPTPVGACTSCGGGDQQVWDQFDLVSNARITEVHAQLTLPLSPWGSSVELSIWDASRTAKLFSRSYAEGELTVVDFVGFGDDVRATGLGWELAAGTYSLSYYYGQPSRRLGWIQSVPTVHGRSFQSGGGAAQNLDMAFRIVGIAIPEPSAVVLCVLAVGMLDRFARQGSRRG